MQQNRPGGWLGLVLLLVLVIAGFIFNIEWMQVWGGGCLTLWVAMLVIGFIAGAKG